MDLGSLLASFVSFAVAFLLLVLSAWFRWGTSRVARWWVRRFPIGNCLILALSVYPAWLRPQRRAEREYLSSL